MIAIFVVPKNESDWTMWINMLFFGVAVLAFSATFILSAFVVATGPKKARFAVFK